MYNHLKNVTSPYLLQHASNPVKWYPWCREAFQKAKEEDKPIFLSIGYSTCHWCHVMAHESFEDEEVAQLLNNWFVSIKVDKEERPDIDSIYMAVCQAMTGSGGWPTSIFLTADQKPFFAGTYFPKQTFKELLTIVHEKWSTARDTFLQQAEQIAAYLNEKQSDEEKADIELTKAAVEWYKRSFDNKNGGFGRAPKFPTAHNLLFLLTYYKRYRDKDCLDMVEKTLLQMYRGGLFDHIGYGFCRYSTDARFLVPHFEKMLYDNALLIMAYVKAYEVTGKQLYLDVAEKTSAYILREMCAYDGSFYSAQDADSDGEEGKFYVFTPKELIDILGKEQAAAFSAHFGITPQGNFEGKSIPNLLNSDVENQSFDLLLPKLQEYRRSRCHLHLDDKVLTSWNSLIIVALCRLYRASKKKKYLFVARQTDGFLRHYHLIQGQLYSSSRNGVRGAKGFLDDYAAYIFAQLELYAVTLENGFLKRAETLCRTVLEQFQDKQGSGFYLYSEGSEQLISRPKETYDGAIPSGNSLMAWNLQRLAQLTEDEFYEKEAIKQLDFLAADAKNYPSGYAMFLLALLDYWEAPAKVTIVPSADEDRAKLPLNLPDDMVAVLKEKSTQFPLKNGKTTYYVCKGRSCQPAVNELPHD